MLKIGIHTNKLPTTVFIDRLINGLSKNNFNVYVFGTKTNSFTRILNARYIGFWLYSKLNYSKTFFYIKYSVLLFLFKNADKKKIDKYLKKHSTKIIHNRTKFYPIIWHRPDVLHVQWVKGIEEFGWLKEFNIKWVVSLRGTQINISPLVYKEIAENYRNWFPKIDGFHAVCNNIRESAELYNMPIGKCHVIYSGVDLNEFQFREPRSWPRLTNQKLKIVSIGRNNWIKGYSYAIDAMKALKDMGVCFEYQIIGTTKGDELLYKIHQLNLENEIKLFDWKTIDEIKEILKDSHVLLISSLKEGIANIAIEAMAIGALVISTNSGGMDELIDNNKNGILVEVGDYRGMANEINSIKNLPLDEVQIALKNARRTIEQNFEEKNMISKFLTFYNSILDIEN